ncbi:MAG: hypothetical protein ACLSCV_01155 [Acutalibacteraceae bacterium]
MKRLPDVSGTAESIAEVSSQEPVSSESVSQAPASSSQNLQREPLKYWIQSKEKYLK